MQKTCLIVPCYNESKRLPTAAIQQALENYPNLFLCLVNDGSKDATTQVLLDLHADQPDDCSRRCWIVSYPSNRGKAGAIQHGLRCMIGQHESIDLIEYREKLSSPDSSFQLGKLELPQFDYYGFWDADLATPFSELDWFFYHAKTDDYILIMGSRVARLGAEIHRTLFRHYSGRLFATLISQGLGWKVHDTQCGAKIFNRQVLDVIIEQPFVTQWLFDVEILLRLKNKFGDTIRDRILELPLRTWKDIKGSKIGLTDFVKVPFQIWKVFRSY